jgi:hypothetical protein
MKPGWQTSEFWVGNVIHFISFLTVSGVIAPNSTAAKVAALIGSAIAFVGYAAGRAVIKKTFMALLADSSLRTMAMNACGRAAAEIMPAIKDQVAADLKAASITNVTMAAAKPGVNAIWAILLLPAVMLLQGCAALTAPSGPYVAADQATYDAISPRYSAYVSNDATLDDATKATELRTVQTWRMRLEQASKGSGFGVQGSGNGSATTQAMPASQPSP